MSISFDPIAARYDATRGFPPAVAETIGPAFRRQSGLPSGARLLEIGVGTGRIALPLAAQGYRYTGVDISLEMMRHLRAQLWPGITVDLMRADATALPLRDASVDAGIAVHVFHLIAGWERAIAELRRVIRPGGTLALGYNESDETSSIDTFRDRWVAIVHELGGDIRRPGAGDRKDVKALLQTTFGPPVTVMLATWERHESLRERIAHIAARTNSDTWQLPEPILRESLRRAEAWAYETYADLDRPHTIAANFTMRFYPT